MSETPLQLQRKAVRMAIRDYERELIKAEDSGRTEWVEDTKSQIKNLRDLLDTLETLQNAITLFSMK